MVHDETAGAVPKPLTTSDDRYVGFLASSMAEDIAQPEHQSNVATRKFHIFFDAPRDVAAGPSPWG